RRSAPRTARRAATGTRKTARRPRAGRRPWPGGAPTPSVFRAGAAGRNASSHRPCRGPPPDYIVILTISIGRFLVKMVINTPPGRRTGMELPHAFAVTVDLVV